MSMFEGLGSEKTIKLPLKDGGVLEVIISTLSTGQVTKIYSTGEDKNAGFKLIFESIRDNHPDETLATVKLMPLYVAEVIISEIMDFNNIQTPE